MSRLPLCGDWVHEGACVGKDPDIFFPEQRDDIGPAVRICCACPVRAECLAYALKYRPPGIWGGTSQRERRRLRKEAAAVA